MKLLILKGLPGSGKSTFGKNFVKENKQYVRVNRDDLRNMRGDYWIPKQEDLITAWENNCIMSAFSMGYSVVLDATNLNEERNKTRFKDLKILFPNLTLETKDFFDVSLEECIKRDLARPNSVGSSVIQKMYNQYLAPAKVVYTEDDSLPHCVIFDVDGTLAKMNGRSPFEWNRVKEDLVKENIADLARMLHKEGKRIVIFTGRDGVCLNDTTEWLDDNKIPFQEIHIRPENNGEKDSIIKKRLFEENIRGKYYCEMVVDDRDQVVKMWREELGLTCLQVDYGNF